MIVLFRPESSSCLPPCPEKGEKVLLEPGRKRALLGGRESGTSAASGLAVDVDEHRDPPAGIGYNPSGIERRSIRWHTRDGDNSWDSAAGSW